MTGVYFVSTNNQKVGRVIVENPHVTFWYVEDAWEHMSYLPGLLEFTRLGLEYLLPFQCSLVFR